MKRNLRVFGTMTAGWVALVAFALTAYSQRGPAPAPGQPAGHQLPRRRPNAARRAVVRAAASAGRDFPEPNPAGPRFKHDVRSVISIPPWIAPLQLP